MYNLIHKDLQDINPYVRVCACTRTYPGWKLVGRIIYDHQLVLTISGHGKTAIGGKNYPTKKGSFFLIKPGVVHSFEADDQDPFVMLVVHFDFFYERDRNFWPHKKFHLGEAEELPDKHLMREVPVFGNSFLFPDSLPAVNYSMMEVLMHKMLDYYGSSIVGKEILLKSALLEIIYLIYSSLTETNHNQSGDPNFDKIRKAFDYINENYAQKISIKSLADLCSLSPNYFATLFKRQTGYAPNEYVIRVRIEKAKQLLQNSRHTISEIGEMVGFNDIHYFSFYFRRIEGLPPSHYRQSMT